MTKPLEAVSGLSDKELLAEVKIAADSERHATARLIALLAQVDERRLYLGEAAHLSSVYCTQVLRLSEHAAYGRIEAARTARRFPVVLDLLTDGSVTLTAVTLLAPHLTPANHRDVLAESHHKSKREIEHIVARLRPEPAVPVDSPEASGTDEAPAVVVRTASHWGPSGRRFGRGSHASPAAPRAVIATPLAPERYKVQLTISRETHDKWRHAQDLLRHSIPNGDAAAILDRALTLLLADLERAKHAATARPRAPRPVASGSRHIPAAVRREVWRRDGGRCAFVGMQGRCTERGFLEFHHIAPYAVGGQAVVENISLRCRAHNVHEAEQLLWESNAATTGGESSDVRCWTRSGPSTQRQYIPVAATRAIAPKHKQRERRETLLEGRDDVARRSSARLRLAPPAATPTGLHPCPIRLGT